ncbi:MAG: permease, partial [Gammaproteobacteria bacterium]|nr:permease [Gammaproteobacteria bacterium]
MFDQLATLITYQWFGLDVLGATGKAVHFFIMDTMKIFFLLFIIIYIMGLLRAMLSPEKIRDYVRGKPKWLARSLAITLGAITPFCSCS